MRTSSAADTSRAHPRFRLILAVCAAAAGLTLLGCGQTGPLYLPDEGVTAPVTIRPGPTPATPPSETEPERPDEEQPRADAADPAMPEPSR